MTRYLIEAVPEYSNSWNVYRFSGPARGGTLTKVGSVIGGGDDDFELQMGKGDNFSRRYFEDFEEVLYFLSNNYQ